MTTEEARNAVKVMEAYANGKKIQCNDNRLGNGEWVTTDNPSFNWDKYIYRIKSEPKYRPFKTKEECWNEMHKHSDFGFIREKGTKVIYSIAMIDNFYLSTSDKSEHLCDTLYVYEFLDGTPFGIKEE